MKKFMTLLLALAMVLSLAACGGGDKPAGDAGDSAPGQAPHVHQRRLPSL